MSNEIKILIVEDDAFTGVCIQRILQNNGYWVLGISPSYETAQLTIENVKPNIVLMDIEIEGDINGIEAAKKIKSNYGAEVIFITSSVDPEVKSQALALSPAGYLSKPINEDDLLDLIEDVVDQVAE